MITLLFAPGPVVKHYGEEGSDTSRMDNERIFLEGKLEFCLTEDSWGLTLREERRRKKWPFLLLNERHVWCSVPLRSAEVHQAGSAGLFGTLQRPRAPLLHPYCYTEERHSPTDVTANVYLYN